MKWSSDCLNMCTVIPVFNPPPFDLWCGWTTCHVILFFLVIMALTVCRSSCVEIIFSTFSLFFWLACAFGIHCVILVRLQNSWLCKSQSTNSLPAFYSPSKTCFIEPQWSEKLCQEPAVNFSFSLRAKWQIGQACPRSQTHGNILPPSSCGQRRTIDRPVTSNLRNKASGLTMTNGNCSTYSQCICIIFP